MDIEDTVETFRMRRGLAMLLASIDELLRAFTLQIERYADVVCMGYTHLQPAEPTTRRLPPRGVRARRADGSCGARVRGHAADGEGHSRRRRHVGIVYAAARRTARARPNSKKPTCSARSISKRATSRRKRIRASSTTRCSRNLAGLGASLSKFAADVRIQSSPGFGEMFEPFGAKQVGSSAMPFKRNPVMSERIDSLARLLPGYADVAWQNAATNFLERTLDDSANRRTILPEAILCTDEILGLREEDRRRPAHRRAQDHREPAHLRAVLGQRSGADGSGARRRRPPRTARSDSRERDGGVRRARTRRDRTRSRNCSRATSAS